MVKQSQGRLKYTPTILRLTNVRINVLRFPIRVRMDFDLYDDLLVGDKEAEPTEKEKLLTDENDALKVRYKYEQKIKILTIIQN